MHNYFEIKLRKYNHKLTNYLEFIKKDLENFFNIKIKQPNIFLLNSRKEIDKIYGQKTKSWLTGWVRYGTIFILNPKNYTKESCHKNILHFWQTLKHEYCHLYFDQLAGISCPRWLNEGLACYLAGQVKKEPKDKDLLKIFNYYSKIDRYIYNISYFWVKLLIKKFGRNKILKLIKSLHPNLSEKHFSNIFYKTFQIRYSKEDFLKLLCHT